MIEHQVVAENESHEHIHSHDTWGGTKHYEVDFTAPHSHEHLHEAVTGDGRCSMHFHAHSHIVEDGAGFRKMTVENADNPTMRDRAADRTAHTAWISEAPFRALTGDERVGNTDASVQDFWRWAFGDLRANTTRGLFAEFLVAKAVGDTNPCRNGWADYDVLTAEGITVEVKAFGHFQTWRQTKLSTPTFSGFLGRRLDESGGSYVGLPELRAQVYLFAVESCQECECYDPLDIGQWDFWIVSVDTVREHAGKTVGMTFLRKHARQVRYENLHKEIVRLAEQS